MKSKSFYLLLFVASVLILQSCVTAKTHYELEERYNESASNLNNTEKKLASTRDSLNMLNANHAELNKNYKNTKEDYDLCKERYNALDRTQRDLNERYEKLLNQYQGILSASAGEKEALVRELTSKENELRNKEKALEQQRQELEREKAALAGQVTDLQGDLTEREKRVKELEDMVNTQRATMEALRNKINNALVGLDDEDFDVRSENGKVYLSLSQNLLFTSGSKTLNTNGTSALKKVADVLNRNKDVEIAVEGHTDSDGDANMNWDLSVGRATSVVKVLTAEGVDPKRITAAGKGEFYPVATNSTAAGKALNRRTEIVLSPKLDELYKLVK